MTNFLQYVFETENLNIMKASSENFHYSYNVFSLFDGLVSGLFYNGLLTRNFYES